MYCTDALSGCTDATKSKSFLESVGTIQSKSQSYEIYDKAGNHINCSKSLKYFIDNTPPTKPTSGSIGNVSGSNNTGTIKTDASGSTDTGGSGVDKYLYCVRTDNTVPSNTDSCFKTSKSFTRTCGTTYKAYAIAVDKVGNRSAVTGLGTTSDGANKYSEWGSCSKSCGTGSQSRTNTCALVTTGLTQNCNTQDCCSSVRYADGSSCSKTCGGGTYNRLAYSKYDGRRCSSKDKSSGGSACNTHGCLPKSSCKVRGNKKRACETWTCSGPGKHTSNYYYQHYCTNDDGTSYYKAPDYNYVCSVAPYGESDGWTVVDD